MSPMRAATATKPIPIKPTIPLGLLLRLLTAWRRRRQLRRDQAALQSQPDYLLRDIGVSRAEIESIIRRRRYR